MTEFGIKLFAWTLGGSACVIVIAVAIWFVAKVIQEL